MVLIRRILSLLLVVVNLFSVSGTGRVLPYFAVLPDMMKVGLDYITLDIDENAVSRKELSVEIEKAVNAAKHPYVLATEDMFLRIKNENKLQNGSEYTDSLYEYSIDNADALVSMAEFAPMKYVLDEEDSILPISREVINRVVILANAYRITGNKAYAERAWQELENVCSYPDWCTSHFLATAEMALAVSIGYDWLFDYLSDGQKDLLAQKVFDYAITPALSKNYIKNWFTWSKNNWNSICYSGIGVACMCFASYYPDEACEFLSMCYKNMPIAFQYFTPNGVYVEGPGYYESGMNAIVNFVATSRNFFGTDFGMSEIDGFEQLGEFAVNITTPTGVFNFGDNENRPGYSPALHWFADAFDNSLISVYEMQDIPKRYVPNVSQSTERNGSGRNYTLCNLWYNRCDADIEKASENFGKSVYLKSDYGQEIVAVRSAFLDKNAIYAGIKGGYNYTNHGDLDVGTFVYEALGERWAEELGRGSYDAPNYFVNLPAGGRWKNYCKRAEGQNTLVINPKMSADDQYPLATGHFTSYSCNESGTVCTLDMSECYCMNGVIKAERTFNINSDCSEFTLTDDVVCAVPSEIYWFMHTKAQIDISEDGKTAILTKNGKKVKVSLSGDGSFSVMNAEALNGAYEYDSQYPDIQKLTVKIKNAYKAHIVVTLTPMQ